MEVNILNEEKDFIELEVKEESHTLCNSLREALNENDSVSFAAYSIKHPLVSSPILVVKTKEGKPRKAIERAVSSLRAQIKDIRSAAKKL